QGRLRPWTSGNQLRTLKKVLGSEDDQLRILERRSVQNLAFEEKDTRGRPRHIGPLREIGRRRFELLQPDLIRDGVFVQDVRQAFYFTGRRSEKCHSPALFYQGPRLRHGDLHIAVKGQRGPC